MGAKIKSTSGPVLEKAGDLAALLTNRSRRRAFIDEIHRQTRHRRNSVPRDGGFSARYYGGRLACGTLH